jgi:hypothetical protein
MVRTSTRPAVSVASITIASSCAFASSVWPRTRLTAVTVISSPPAPVTTIGPARLKMSSEPAWPTLKVRVTVSLDSGPLRDSW